MATPGLHGASSARRGLRVHDWTAPHFDRTVRHDHGRLEPVLEDMLMPGETHPRVEVITGLAGRRYWPAQRTLRIIEGEEDRGPYGAA